MLNAGEGVRRAMRVVRGGTRTEEATKNEVPPVWCSVLSSLPRCRPCSLFRSLKSGKSVRARRALASISGWMIYVLILSPMSLLRLSAIMSVKLAPFLMVRNRGRTS